MNIGFLIPEVHQSQFLYAIPFWVLGALLHAEDDSDEKRLATACVHVLIDLDNCGLKSQREYARILGTNRYWVRSRWEKIMQHVATWASSYGRQLDGPLGKKLPPEWRAWVQERYPAEPPGNTHQLPNKAPRIPEKEGTITRTPTNAPPKKRPHTNHPSSQSSKLPYSSSKKRGNEARIDELLVRARALKLASGGGDSRTVNELLREVGVYPEIAEKIVGDFNELYILNNLEDWLIAATANRRVTVGLLVNSILNDTPIRCPKPSPKLFTHKEAVEELGKYGEGKKLLDLFELVPRENSTPLLKRRYSPQ